MALVPTTSESHATELSISSSTSRHIAPNVTPQNNTRGARRDYGKMLNTSYTRNKPRMANTKIAASARPSQAVSDTSDNIVQPSMSYLNKLFCPSMQIPTRTRSTQTSTVVGKHPTAFASAPVCRLPLDLAPAT